jgi:hypothetical protein
MTDLEPKIFRQRLIIEGHFDIKADGQTIKDYLNKLSKVCEMRVFSGPYSWPPDKWDNSNVPLYELNGFVAWTESGSHVYAWGIVNFLQLMFIVVSHSMLIKF